MGSQIASLQKAPDYFALLKLPPTYALTEDQIHTAAAAAGSTLDAAGAGADTTTQAAIDDTRKRVDQAVATLLDPVDRGEYLLNVFDSAKDANAVPPDFHDTLTSLQNELAGAVATRDDERLIRVHEHLIEEQQKHLNRVAEVFSFPRNVPNPVSQVARDFAIRTELNAVRLLDQVLKEL